MLLLYTLFIAKIKTGIMPNNNGTTVNKDLKDIVDKEEIECEEEVGATSAIITHTSPKKK